LHHQSNQLRAIKLIKKESVDYQDDEKKFLKEIGILKYLDHPNILKIFEYFIDNKYYYVVTELCEGGELFDQLSKIHNFCEREASQIMEQIFSTVFYMHSKGVVHRDLKPENILIEKLNEDNIFIKLIDFGTSNYFDNRTKFSYKIGTAYYIAPEVIKQSYNNKCDLWSCGVILYILLSGMAPFDGKNDHEIMENVMKGAYNFDDEIWENVSEDAKRLIRNLIRFDPNKRYSAEQAYNDPWIQKYKMKKKSDCPSNLINLKNLKKFCFKAKIPTSYDSFPCPPNLNWGYGKGP